MQEKQVLVRLAVFMGFCCSSSKISSHNSINKNKENSDNYTKEIE